MDEQRVCLAGEADLGPGASGRFEIIGISAGSANGWEFGESVLQESLALWDGVATFVDHAGFGWSGRSVRDLAGVCFEPVWDEGEKGIKLQLRPSGPCGHLLQAIGQEMLGAASGPKPRVGFSADIGFKATGREVKQISRVFSLDLVFDPARGGKFLRALNSLQGDVTVEEQQEKKPVVEGAPAPGQAADAGAEAAAAREHLEVRREVGLLKEQAEKARAVRLEMCQMFLTAGLAASKLPVPAQEIVREEFAGKIFEPADLTSAIEKMRTLVGALSGPGTVSGPAQVRGMFNGADQLQAAVDDLFEVPREKGAENVKVARLSGIKELYMGLTGDFDLHGGLFPDRAQFQHTTATFTGLVKNAMNKAVVQSWNRLGREGYEWWRKICHIEHFNTMHQITWVIFGTVGLLPSVSEGAEYGELKIGDSPETSDFVKYGGYVGVTLEAIDRDDTRKLKRIPRELANGALRRISALVAAVFTENSGVGPTLADGGALFNATAVTTAGGHANLLTTALSADQWEVVSTAVYNQPMLVANESGYIGTGSKMAVNPKYLLVPRALQLTGRKILEPLWENSANIHSENLMRQGADAVVTVPEWTDANDWAAVCDPEIVPGICIGERFGLIPEVFIAGDELSPAVFMNDESRIKVRHVVAVGVADFRPLHKSNVA